MVTYVDLDRFFVPVGRDQELSFDLGRAWGPKLGGWLNWSELSEYRRVVLLAEASSGKSAEFQGQADKLTVDGNAAFFVRIEELVDQGLVAALAPGDVEAFEQWSNGSGDGWFFLDSVDEARLNSKSFEVALKRFARELGRSVERARVFISCRVSDWKGHEDRALIERLLPDWEQPKPAEDDNRTSLLLDPIFKKNSHPSTQTSRHSERKSKELLVVQLVPLSTGQHRKFAAALGVDNVDTFIKGIEQNGLDAFTERPGDLMDLANYWQSYGCFGTFAAMVEHSVNRKLVELNAYRPDNDTLSLEKAREGAERIAASLILGKSSALRAPGQEPDPSLAPGALEPALILEDWNPSEQNALLRRAVFAPSTYGRVRFHHRSTQEYLAAQWFHRLLCSNCPRDEVWNLLFASSYGIDTVVPSLRPIAAWLALRDPDLMREIISREPLVLLRHGDSRSIPIEAKKKLLAVYAAKHAAAEISDDSVGHREMWMFADKRLATAIHEAWTTNPRPDFRTDLLRLIREGAISECTDLARATALDESGGDYQRIVALQALQECKDESSLVLVAKELVAECGKFSPRLVPDIAKVLYPSHLTTKQLLSLVEQCQSDSRNTSEGFAYSIRQFYEACPGIDARRDFVAGIADVCFSPPFVDDFQRVSVKHLWLAENLGPIAVHEMQSLGQGDPSDGIVRLLMVVERAEQSAGWEKEHPRLDKLVQANIRVQRALFWADVEEQRANCKEERQLFKYWQQVHLLGSRLWAFGTADLLWLYEDLAQRPEADQRIALSAIISILRSTGRLDVEVAGLRERVCDHPVLMEDLNGYLMPFQEDEENIRHRLLMEGYARRRVEEEEAAKASWVEFSEYLQANVGQLRNPQHLTSWKAGAFRMAGLTEWLERRAGRQDKDTPQKWRLLGEGFGRTVAEAYRDGMKMLWRVTKPERPKRKEGSGITIKRTTTLAYGAVGLEAAEDPAWTSHLSDVDAQRAALHGCLSEQGYPEWINELIESHPQIVLPVIKRCLKQEWSSAFAGRADFLIHLSRPATPIQKPVQSMLLSLVSKEPPDLGKLDTWLRIVPKTELDQQQRHRLVRIARRRFVDHVHADDNDRALRYLGLLFVVDADRGIAALDRWLSIDGYPRCQISAELIFGFLFDRDDPVAGGALGLASVPKLETLLRLVYRHIRPEDDFVHEGVYTRGVRDNAESARNLILTAVLSRPGPDAYYALKRAAAEPECALREDRFLELARGKAERDAEIPAWSIQDVLGFERDHAVPVKTGHDLLRVVMAVLKDIQFRLDRGDASSRSLLQHARDEEEVQKWIVEQMDFRSQGRFTTYREAQVANRDKPDIIVSSSVAHCEVAIEVKHGGKQWTCRDLERALRHQLAVNYLKPTTRRHGVLIVTNHSCRHWVNPETKKKMSFAELLGWLSRIAETLANNGSGPIETKCFGIDASDCVL